MLNMKEFWLLVVICSSSLCFGFALKYHTTGLGSGGGSSRQGGDFVHFGWDITRVDLLFC